MLPGRSVADGARRARARPACDRSSTARGRRCPLPILDLARHIGDVAVGATITVEADDPAAGPDIARLVPDARPRVRRRGRCDRRHAGVRGAPAALTRTGILDGVCGLIGFLSADGGAAAGGRRRRGRRCTDMRHRGPDEGGVWYDDDVVIGFRRLSIIDIDHSHQPLPWLDGRYHLIFNGEIYNYLELRERLAREFGATFETDGDGEAIVAGYHYLGEKVVRELRGMFAFLIWDTQERVLFGARDWFGIKPLYTYADERGTFFASEKKSLLDVAEPGVATRRRHRPRCSTT